jgi:hypothetical protein
VAVVTSANASMPKLRTTRTCRINSKGTFGFISGFNFRIALFRKAEPVGSGNSFDHLALAPRLVDWLRMNSQSLFKNSTHLAVLEMV